MRTGHLRLLLWLRLRTMLRQKSRLAWGAVVATFLLLGVPLTVGGALVTALGTRWAASQQDPRLLTEWIHLVLLVVWLLFLMRATLTFGTNEFYDVTKLFHFPVRPVTVFAAQTIGVFLSPGTLFFTVPLLGLALSIPGRGAPGAALHVGVVLLFVVHAIILGQLLQLALLNVLRSRRFRDLASILVALLSAGLYLSFRLAGTTTDVSGFVHALLSKHFARFTVALPPHWTAVVLDRSATTADWILFGGTLVPLTVLALLLAIWFLKKAYLSEIPITVGQAVVTSDRDVTRARFPLTLVPDDVRAVAGREFQLLRRDPLIKSMLIQQFAFILGPFAIALFTGAHSAPTIALTRIFDWLVFPLFLVESVLALNLFGLEGGGIVATALTPMPRERVLSGKILAYFMLFEVLNLLVLGVVVLALAGVGHAVSAASSVARATEATAGLLILLGIGAVTSVVAPMRLTARSRGTLASSQAGRMGCGVVFYRMVVMLLLAALLAPLALLIKYGGGVPLVGLGLLYALALLAAGWWMGARLFRGRESRLIAALVRSPE
jgi:hypothetical protein